MSNLKIVGEIKPPEFKDPVRMLRNIADEIEAGDYGEVNTIAIATFGDAGLQLFGGGSDSLGPSVAMVFQAASIKMCQSLIETEGLL